MSVQAKTSTFLPFMTMATNMSHAARFADIFLGVAIVSTLSAKCLRHLVQLSARCTSRTKIVTTTKKAGNECEINK